MALESGVASAREVCAVQAERHVKREDDSFADLGEEEELVKGPTSGVSLVCSGQAYVRTE